MTPANLPPNMSPGKPLSYAIAVALAAAVTLVAGVIQGHLRNRWGISEETQCAARKLQELPEQLGNWRLEAKEKLDDTTVRMLECAGYIQRRYIHQGTGETVTLILLLGPAGPISVHTPEICYGSRAGELQGKRERVTIHGGEGEDGTDEFWITKFRSRDPSGTILYVYYGWSPGDRWSAPEDARFTFAGRPFLYKLQLSTSALADGDQEPGETYRTFLKDLLPVARHYISLPAGRSRLRR